VGVWHVEEHDSAPSSPKPGALTEFGASSLFYHCSQLTRRLEVGPAWRSSSRDARILKTMRCLPNSYNSATTTLKVMKLKEVDLL